MGNCQAAEAATVVIQHPGGDKVDRIYWSVSANEIMSSNPGHYVAQLVASPAAKTENGTPVKQLKLLRPDDTLVIGHVYRLVSFEDVLKVFAAKKCGKLGRLLKERGALHLEPKKNEPFLQPSSNPQSASIKAEQPNEVHHIGSGGGSSSSRGGGKHHLGGGGQWRPALQSILEHGT